MAEEFEGRDLTDAVFWGVDLSGARFRDVNLTNAAISHAWLVNVDIDGLIDHVTINGVDVTAYVNERDAWFPLRGMLRPVDGQGLRSAWEALEQAWATTIERAQQLTETQLSERVGGEWSFVETLRHLVFGVDKWFSVPVLAEHEFQSIGIANTGSAGLDWPGIDRGADPRFADVLAIRAEQGERLREYLDHVTPDELARPVEVLENGTTPVLECLYTVFEEAFEHNRYATRDLEHLEHSRA